MMIYWDEKIIAESHINAVPVLYRNKKGLTFFCKTLQILKVFAQCLYLLFAKFTDTINNMHLYSIVFLVFLCNASMKLWWGREKNQCFQFATYSILWDDFLSTHFGKYEPWHSSKVNAICPICIWLLKIGARFAIEKKWVYKKIEEIEAIRTISKADAAI